MTPISSTAPHSLAASAARAAKRIKEAHSAPSPSAGSLKPDRDEYVPEERRKESFGRYWLGKDEDGSPRIYFDDPEKDVSASQPALREEGTDEEPETPEKAAPAGGDRRKERCVCDTGKVDREIEKAKKKREELERQLVSEKDETKRRDLERKLAQAENAVKQKDNDAYRRRHATFTEG